MAKPSGRTTKYKKSSVHNGKQGVYCTLFLAGTAQKNAVEFGEATSALMGSAAPQHAEPKWWALNEPKLMNHLKSNEEAILSMEFEVSADLCQSCRPLFENHLQKVFGGKTWGFPILVFIIREKIAYQLQGNSLVVVPWG
ncbi:hypothetical protein N8590_04175 [bacterium]|nr:hypothetical protein [bacterium]